MMRQIKFRAWHKEMGWASSVCVYHDGSWSATYGIVEGYDADNGVILMEFTGLVDRNGKEVYEGDIVEYLVNTASGLVRRLVVIEDIRYLPDFQCSQWQEIIGNVYEMVEKLKVNHAQS